MKIVSADYWELDGWLEFENKKYYFQWDGKSEPTVEVALKYVLEDKFDENLKRNEILEEVARWHDQMRQVSIEAKEAHLNSPSMKTPGHEIHVQYSERQAEFHRYSAEAVRLMKDK